MEDDSDALPAAILARLQGVKLWRATAAEREAQAREAAAIKSAGSYEETQAAYREALDLATDPSLPAHKRGEWRKRQRALGGQLARMRRRGARE
jgi:hypothetical protein